MMCAADATRKANNQSAMSHLSSMIFLTVKD